VSDATFELATKTEYAVQRRVPPSNEGCGSAESSATEVTEPQSQAAGSDRNDPGATSLEGGQDGNDRESRAEGEEEQSQRPPLHLDG